MLSFFSVVEHVGDFGFSYTLTVSRRHEIFMAGHFTDHRHIGPGGQRNIAHVEQHQAAGLYGKLVELDGGWCPHLNLHLISEGEPSRVVAHRVGE